MTSEAVTGRTRPYHLFQAYGVELEYMIVSAESLDIQPLTDRLLHEVAGAFVSEVELGTVAWSNELALHVIEFKTNGPAESLEPLAGRFQSQVARANSLLEPMGARLMPTAMHPWMDPHRELRLWPHDYNPIYEAYNRIFDCRGHGWANLQSVHLNLPFADDGEFGRLHAAIRLLLPLLPALAASSPVADRQLAPFADYRMEVYRTNSQQVPSLAAEVIPEAVFTRADYDREVLQPMYREIAPLDPAGRLQNEWLNSRGAIARFDRNTIEIRVLDVQECPAADLAICSAITDVLRALVSERWTSLSDQQAVAVPPLAQLLLGTIRTAERTVIDDRTLLAQFGVAETSVSAQELWQHLVETVVEVPAGGGPLDTILRHGSLSRRIERSLAGDLAQLEPVYRELCDCLAEGRMFAGE